MILNEQKAALRREIRAAIKKIPPAARAAASAQLCARLKEQTFWKNAGSVLFFAPLPDETDVWPLLQETVTGGKIVALPRLDPADQTYMARRVQNPQNEITIGPFGIREPEPGCTEIAMSRLDLILVPGVAFDVCGHRLGRGRGFYDRLLAEVCGVKCGLAFNEQIVPTIPVKAHDVRMDFIITPTRCVRIAG
jgi:5-formyltetrahydrofolate cyclo-ligase